MILPSRLGAYAAARAREPLGNGVPARNQNQCPDRNAARRYEECRGGFRQFDRRTGKYAADGDAGGVGGREPRVGLSRVRGRGDLVERQGARRPLRGRGKAGHDEQQPSAGSELARASGTIVAAAQAISSTSRRAGGELHERAP
jgi:hypothetical protein